MDGKPQNIVISTRLTHPHLGDSEMSAILKGHQTKHRLISYMPIFVGYDPDLFSICSNYMSKKHPSGH